MDSLSKRLGENLRKKRGDASQVEFARKLGIAQSSLNRLENGEQNATLRMVERLAARLRCKPLELLK